MNSLKILYVDIEKVWRGGQEQLLTLMVGMKDRQHRVWLAAPPKSRLSKKAREIGIRTVPFNQRNELSLWAFFQLWNILRKTDCDIIHLNTSRTILCAGLASKLCGVPFQVCSRRVNFPLKSRFSRLKYNWMQDSVVTVSHSIRQTLIEGGIRPELINVIYEGVDLNWIDLLKPPPLAHAKNGLVVGTVAHLSPEKGHHTLLEAAAKVAYGFPDVVFVFVGAGHLRSELEKKVQELSIQEHVVFSGFRSDSEALMKNFDIFCLPSLSEGLSSAILVAMASRLPVVTTRVGGIPELVVDGETGILVPPNDAEQLAAALSKILGSRDLRQKMGNAGRRRVKETFTLKRKLDETEDLYSRLLASAGIG